MAYYRRRRRRRSRRRRRTYRRRRRRYRKRKPAMMRISHRRMPTIFPDNVSVTMPYSDRIRFSMVAGVTQSYTWRLNSIADPDAIDTAVNRPLGFDQWNGFYAEYICYASSIHLEFLSDLPSPFEIAIGADANLTPPSTLGHCKELPNYRTRVCSSAYAPAFTIGNKAAVKALEGKRLGSEDDFQAAFQSNPVRQYFWQMLISSPFATGDVDVRVTVHYKCRLLRRRLELPEST